MLYPKVSDIIHKFFKLDEKNYGPLRNKLSQFRNIFQYVYSSMYPKIYCSTDLESTFHIVFKTYKDKKKSTEETGKNPQN